MHSFSKERIKLELLKLIFKRLTDKTDVTYLGQMAYQAANP